MNRMAEKEYLERGMVLELLNDVDRCGYLDASDINSIPAADVAPVVHGRWEVDEFGHFCSACREYAEEIERGEDLQLAPMLTPYCPNCGAKMDLEGGNDQ